MVSSLLHVDQYAEAHNLQLCSMSFPNLQTTVSRNLSLELIQEAIPACCPPTQVFGCKWREVAMAV